MVKQFFFALLFAASASAQNTDGVQTITYFLSPGDSWEAWMRQQLSYDQGLMASAIYQVWDASTSTWKNSSDVQITRNAQGLESERLYHYWDADAQAWFNLFRQTMQYDVAGHLTQRASADWNIDHWENQDRTTFSFAGDFMTEQLIEAWSTETNAWTNDTRTTYVDGGSGQIASSLAQTWFDNGWYNTTQTVNTYNDGLLSVAVASSWVIDHWDTSYRFSYTYENGLQVQELREDWASVWSNSTLLTYTYENDRLSTYTLQNWTAGAWDDNSHAEFDYGALATKRFEPRMTLYPNPVDATLHLDSKEGSSVRVADLSGRTVTVQKIGNQGTIDVSQLPAQTYTITVEKDGQTQSAKIIKR